MKKFKRTQSSYLAENWPCYHNFTLSKKGVVIAMANSKLLEIIQAFSPEERAEFSLFLKSPFFVRGGAEEMLRFFNCIVEADKGNQDAYFNKENLHKLVYPEKPFSEARLERAATRLYQFAEQFLCTQQYHHTSNAHQHLLDLTSIFRVKNMAVQYEKLLSKLKKRTRENALESSENHLFQYQIAREEHIWRNLTNNGKGDLAIHDLIESLTLFYHTEQAGALNLFLLQQKLGAPEKTKTIELALEATPVPDYFERKSPLLGIGKKIRESFFQSEPNRTKFDNLVALIKEHEDKISIEVISDLYSFLRSYCSYLISTGHTDLQETLHEIQKYSLNKDYIYYKNTISPSNLTNITRVALGINKIQWAKDFVESNRHKISNEGELEEIYKLNLALCLFEEKKYEEALLHTEYSFYSNVYFLVARRLELRVYYELRSDLLPYKIEAFRKYIERTGSKKASDLDWEASANFVNILLQLAQSALKNAKRSARIIQRIQQKKIIAERKWLLEKARELA